MIKPKEVLIGLEVLIEGFYKGARSLLRGHYQPARDIRQKNALIFLANGPSLNKIRWEELHGPQTEYACVNYFPLKDERFWTLRPSYLCLIDPLFWDTGAETKAQENVRRLVESLEKVDWPLKIVTCNEATLNLKNPQISYLRFTPHALTHKGMRRFRHWMYRHNLTNCGVQNVAVGSLYFFVNAGYKEIYMAGIDMSEFAGLCVDENNDIFCCTQHFYGKAKVDMHAGGLVKKGEFCDLLQLYCKMFAEFRALAEYAASRNASIVNLSPYSYVDVFPKDVSYYRDEPDATA